MDREATRTSFLLALMVALVVVGLRFATPYELQETDQGKQAQYALDAVKNGNWLAPGCLGEPATKPPLYTWLAGLVCVWSGRIDETTIRVPTALAGLGLVLVTWDIGRRLAGPAVGAAAAVVLATSHHFAALCGVVRTDGLLALLLAAQMLVYVRSLDAAAPSLSSVLAAAGLAAAACLTKGPAGLVACAAVALHLAWTGRARRIGLLAVAPAVTALCLFGAWYYAAGAARPGISETMYDNEFKRKLMEEGPPNPLYYVIHTPLRLAPWTVLLVPAIWLAVRAIRRRRAEPVAPLTSLAACWTLVVLATFSFFPHQRPDLIYPSEPALALLMGALVVREFPRWAPGATALLLAGIAVAIASGLADPLMPPDAPRWVVWTAVALLAAGALVAFAGRRRARAAACFAGLAAAGLANVVIDTLGQAPCVERDSYLEFAREAQRRAGERGVPLVVIGVKHPAPLFDLGLTELPRGAGQLARLQRPLVVVATPGALARVEQIAGSVEVLARHEPEDESRTRLVLAVAK